MQLIVYVMIQITVMVCHWMLTIQEDVQLFIEEALYMKLE